MNNEINGENLEYAANMAGRLGKAYYRCSVLLPALFILVIGIIGFLTGNWWLSILYLVIILYLYKNTRTKSNSFIEAENEMRQCLELEKEEYELSDETMKVFNASVPSVKALLFGIISLGICFLVCFLMGFVIIKQAFYKVFDAPTLVVGIFMQLISCAFLPLIISWLVMLPEAVKLSKKRKE